MNVIAGDATVEQLFNLALVWNVADFYELTKEHLLKLEGWKERSADRFLKSLDESRKVPFERVLYALGIRYVGEATAKSVARHYGNIEAIMNATVEDLLCIEDVGQVIAESIHDFFEDGSNKEIVSRLKTVGLQFETTETPKQISAALEGKAIVISGNFSISRDEMKALIVSHGGKNSGSISGKTAFLLAGDKPGPEKIKKAESLGVAILSESEFRSMISEDGSPTPEPTEIIELTLF